MSKRRRRRDRIHAPEDSIHQRPDRSRVPPPTAPPAGRPFENYGEQLIRLQHDRQELGAAAYLTPISAYLSLPHLRAFWPFSSADETGQVYDISGQGRHLTKNSTVNLKNQGLTPYADLNAAGYYSRADEAGLSPTADVTFGAWVWLNTGFSDVMYMGKMGASGGGDLSFGLHAATVVGTERFQLHISDNGSNDETVHYEPAEPLDVWHFVVGRFTNTQAVIFVDEHKTTSTFTATVINDATQQLTLGQSPYTGASTYLDGRLAYPFICATALADAVIAHLFDATRAIFNR